MTAAFALVTGWMPSIIQTVVGLIILLFIAFATGKLIKSVIDIFKG